MKFKNLGELNKIYNFQNTKFFVKYWNSDLSSYKIFLNIIRINVILQVHLVVVYIRMK